MTPKCSIARENGAFLLVSGFPSTRCRCASPIRSCGRDIAVGSYRQSLHVAILRGRACRCRKHCRPTDHRPCTVTPKGQSEEGLDAILLYTNDTSRLERFTARVSARSRGQGRGVESRCRAAMMSAASARPFQGSLSNRLAVSSLRTRWRSIETAAALPQHSITCTSLI
jgi:hypothetical protein